MDHLSFLQTILEQLVDLEDPQETAYLLRSLADEIEEGAELTREDVVAAIQVVAETL